MIKFPENFFWGSATSAEQSEGRIENDGKLKTTWDKFFEEEKYKFHSEIGPSITSTIYKHFKDDIKLLKETGHNSFRTSISWARLLNEDGKINQKAVNFYRTYFLLLKENGIEPFVNLYHFDTPLYIQEKYEGFASKKTESYLLKAHEIQTDLIQKEVKGEKTELSVLFIHAQDHLMSCIEVKNLASKIIKMCAKINKLK